MIDAPTARAPASDTAASNSAAAPDGLSSTRRERRMLEAENRRQPITLAAIPPAQWPERLRHAGHAPSEVWRSRSFLVQVFAERKGAERLSICRTSIAGDRFADGITWDELQRLKRECGRGDKDAVEIFPPDRDVVNVANLRHLWVLAEPLSFAWRAASPPSPATGADARGGEPVPSDGTDSAATPISAGTEKE